MKKLRSFMKTETSPSTNMKSLVHRSMKDVGLLSHSNSWLHKFYQFGHICLCSVTAMLMITIVTQDSSKKMFECFSVLTFTLMGVLKLRSIRDNRKIWLSFVDDIEALEKQQTERTSEEYETDDEETELIVVSAHVKQYTHRAQVQSLLLRRLYRFTLIIFITAPFVEYFSRQSIEPEEVELPYIIPGWSFLSNMGVVGYIVSVVIQFMGSVYCVVLHAAFDGIIVNLLIFASEQFSLVKDCCKRIGGKGRLLRQSQKRDLRAHGRIKKCHRDYIYLVNFITKMNNLLKNILGIYFLVAALTLCATAFRLKTEQLGMMQVISLLQYLCSSLVQIFMYCYYGDAVLYQSSLRMGEGPFAASYWCLGGRVRRELVLLGAGMMRPRRISAGPFNSLDLSSFIQIVRAAYSYYAVLQK